eukprot:680315-Pleurochrysis_carterae.AAC.1
MSQATNEDPVPALVSDFLPLWISEYEIIDEAAAAFQRKLTLSKINTTKVMRRVSRERWAETFSSIGLMEGDLVNLELLLFPLPLEQPSSNSGAA